MRWKSALELEIALAEEPDGLSVHWTLRACAEYPPRPGQASHWEIRATHRTRVPYYDADPGPPDRERDRRVRRWEARTPRDRFGPSPLVRALGEQFESRAIGTLFREQLAETRERGGWARIAIAAPPEWLGAPWEEEFGESALVRRVRSPAIHGPLEFPLRVAASGCLAATVSAAFQRDPMLRVAIEAGALAHRPVPIEALADRVGEIADIVFACASCAAAPDAGAWNRGLSRWRPRLIVACPFGSGDGDDAIAGLSRDSGASAVLASPFGTDEIVTVLRGIAADTPLDVIASRIRGAVLYCAPGAETCVSLSSALGDALQIESREDVHGTVTEPTTLSDAWSQALDEPLRQIDEQAARAEFTAGADGARAELANAVALGRVARTLVAEQPAAANVLTHIERDRGFDRASTRAVVAEIARAPSGDPLPPGQSLAIDEPYQLHIQIAQPRKSTWATAALRDAGLDATLARLGNTDLGVAIYADPDRVELAQHRGTISLPRLGNSAPLAIALRLRRDGAFAIRICVFHGTALLQSMLVKGVAGPTDVGDVARSTVQLDYAASGHFMLLDRHAQPDATIWANDTGDGQHWIGVFARDGFLPVAREMVRLDGDDLANVARGLQQALGDVQLVPGREPRYRFADPNADGIPKLLTLARAGWEAYTALFGRHEEQSPAPAEGLLAIALCRPGRTNLPWAALYDHYLDGNQLELCNVFRKERTLPGAAACRARPECPLRDPARASRTVCPFGFWGIRHRIELPLSHLVVDDSAADAADVSYDELQRATHQPQAVPCQPGQGPRIAIAAAPDLRAKAQTHLDQVAALASSASCETQRDAVLAHMAAAEHEIYYFFCHGVGERLTFRLRIQGDISVGDLNHARYRWTAPALVFLNGCETMALRSDRIHKLLEQLRTMGAAGVIGTEIEVHTALARDVGHRVLVALTGGAPLGDAFLTMRRALLCEQLNPLGLAYTFFASAQLHLCTPGGCATCARTPDASVCSQRRV